MQNTIYIKHEIANVINIAKIITIHYFEYGKIINFMGKAMTSGKLYIQTRGICA